VPIVSRAGGSGWESDCRAGDGPSFYGIAGKANMENLASESVKIEGPEGNEEYLLNEKDHGDMIVYDIYRKGRYLLTMASDGSILFMNFDADPGDKELFTLSHLNRFIEKIQSLS
jgi:hypothetical protein